jgi:hypothetical protein
MQSPLKTRVASKKRTENLSFVIITWYVSFYNIDSRTGRETKALEVTFQEAEPLKTGKLILTNLYNYIEL